MQFSFSETTFMSRGAGSFSAACKLRLFCSPLFLIWAAVVVEQFLSWNNPPGGQREFETIKNAACLFQISVLFHTMMCLSSIFSSCCSVTKIIWSKSQQLAAASLWAPHSCVMWHRTILTNTVRASAARRQTNRAHMLMSGGLVISVVTHRSRITAEVTSVITRWRDERGWVRLQLRRQRGCWDVWDCSGGGWWV